MAELTMVERAADALQNLGECDMSPSTARRMASALIEAMREPTPEMIAAGYIGEYVAVEDVWRAMVDAALKD